MTCDGTEHELGVEAGLTGLDFVRMTSGVEIPAWPRPQGGIGTRVNARLLGVAVDADLDALQITLYAVPPQEALETEEGGACGAGCTDGLACVDDVCRLEISEQTYMMFPRACLDDGSVHVAEIPIRFKNGLLLDDLHLREVDLTLTLLPTGGDPVYDEVGVVIRVGDFVQPSCWDEDNDEPC